MIATRLWTGVAALTLALTGTPASAQNLEVTGTTTGRGNASFGGNVTVAGTLQANGNASVARDVAIGGTASVGALDVKGSTAVAGNARVLGNETVNGALTVQGNAAVNGTLTVQGNAVSPLALLPTGSVIPFVGTEAPPGFLLCRGATLWIASYPALFNVIGTRFGGDGTATFMIPDLRGMFVRGFDPDGVRDGGRALGSRQEHNVQPHRHGVGGTGGTRTSGGDTYAVNSYWDAGAFTARFTGRVIQDADATTGQGIYETRPVNIALNYIIKY